MSKKVLIVEDDPLLAEFLALLIEDELGCVAVNAPSVAKARPLLNSGIDLALLDVEVEDGATYDLAIDMSRQKIPLAFISGSDPAKVPREIADAPFLRKPAPNSTILALARRYV